MSTNCLTSVEDVKAVAQIRRNWFRIFVCLSSIREKKRRKCDRLHTQALVTCLWDRTLAKGCGTPGSNPMRRARPLHISNSGLYWHNITLFWIRPPVSVAVVLISAARLLGRVDVAYTYQRHVSDLPSHPRHQRYALSDCGQPPAMKQTQLVAVIRSWLDFHGKQDSVATFPRSQTWCWPVVFATAWGVTRPGTGRGASHVQLASCGILDGPGVPAPP